MSQERNGSCGQHRSESPSGFGTQDAGRRHEKSARVLYAASGELADHLEDGAGELRDSRSKPVVADAHYALAMYHHRKAATAFKQMQFQFTANYLTLATKHLDQAVECSGTPATPEIDRITVETRDFVRRLLEQSSSAVDIGPMMQSLGRLIEQLGTVLAELRAHGIGVSSHKPRAIA